MGVLDVPGDLIHRGWEYRRRHAPVGAACTLPSARRDSAVAAWGYREPVKPRRGSYGVDAPALLIVPAVLLVGGIVQGVLTASIWPYVGAALVLGFSAIGWYASRRGKFVVWDQILADLHLVGDEDILDIGCGRGAVLLLAAQRLPAGRATGVDLWRAGDRTGNAATATRANAEAEGVADRVDLITADMTALPSRTAASTSSYPMSRCTT